MQITKADRWFYCVNSVEIFCFCRSSLQHKNPHCCEVHANVVPFIVREGMQSELLA